jgi:hypothetical protein
VLQGLLELALIQARTVEDYRESLATALTEMARLTACFENVRQLVRLQQPASDVCDFSLSQTLQDVIDGFPGAKVVGNPAEADLVQASQGRARQALGLLMSAVLLNSGEAPEISIEPLPLALAVQLSVAGDFDSLASSLEMAQLVAASAGCEIRFSQALDSVSFILPIAGTDQPTHQKGTLTHV